MRNILLLVVLLTLLLVVLLTACTSAERVAHEQLGSDVQCISSSRQLAYCVTPDGAGFLCDINRCIPMARGQAEKVMMLLEDDRQRQENEDTNSGM